MTESPLSSNLGAPRPPALLRFLRAVSILGNCALAIIPVIGFVTSYRPNLQFWVPTVFCILLVATSIASLAMRRSRTLVLASLAINGLVLVLLGLTWSKLIGISPFALLVALPALLTIISVIALSLYGRRYAERVA